MHAYETLMLIGTNMKKNPPPRRGKSPPRLWYALFLMRFPCITSPGQSTVRPSLPVTHETLASRPSLKLQTVSHTLPHALLELGRIVSPQPRRLNVGRTLVIRA